MHELVHKIKGSITLCTILRILLHTSADKNAINQQIFLMAIQENPNKAYPSIVAHHQVALEYSTISQKVIHSFETNIF